MSTLKILLKRNIKLFFKDKAMFFTSLITPVILLVLYATFLSNVYTDIFHDSLAGAIEVSESLIKGCVGGQLISSILAVSCVTVAFCSNMLMVQDKVTGVAKDFKTSPVKPSALAVSYYLATLASTLIICFVSTCICLLYIASVGWYMSVLDVILLFADVVLLVLFGTALSSIINFFLSTQGQISAVGTIVSSAYGFICGAYMPISQFSTGLQRVISFLPGTYGTSIIRNCAMRGVFEEMKSIGFPTEVVEKIRDSVDCNLYFFGNKVELPVMYLILGGSVVLLIGIFIAMNVIKGKRV
ncbi:MAG: ABC transporter permease [Acutalibacteraceae bacterium]|nr:ABC transporter permease [Acutalibacteraceae bacterium]